jgi:hypothetical protein
MYKSLGTDKIHAELITLRDIFYTIRKHSHSFRLLKKCQSNGMDISVPLIKFVIVLNVIILEEYHRSHSRSLKNINQLSSVKSNSIKETN